MQITSFGILLVSEKEMPNAFFVSGNLITDRPTIFTGFVNVHCSLLNDIRLTDIVKPIVVNFIL